jgi:hypothetical protein
VATAATTTSAATIATRTAMTPPRSGGHAIQALVLILSQAYQNGGSLFIPWDQSEGSDGPIGMIVLSP